MRGRFTAGVLLGAALFHLLDKGNYRNYVHQLHAPPPATLFVRPQMPVLGRKGGSASYFRHRFIARRSAPKELVDLYGMKSRELKLFLKEKGVSVDDCFDPESLMARAAETQETWASETPKATSPNAAKAPASTPAAASTPTPAPAPASTPASASARAPPTQAEIEAAWTRIRDAWPGKDVLEFGPADADKSVILLHGFGDTDAQFMSKNFEILQDIKGMRLLLPQAPEETLQDARMQSWFLPTNGQWTLDDRVAAPTIAYVHTMIRREIGRGLSPHRIVVGGFGQGGGLAVRAALSFADATLGGAVALSSFFGAPGATVVPANKGLKVLVCHGTDDEVVEFSEGERMAKLFSGLQKGGEVSFKSYKMGHGVSRDEFTDVLEFIRDRMEAPEDVPLSYDPIGFETPEPEPEPVTPPPLPVEEPDIRQEVPQGVPTLDPKLTTQLMNDPDMIEATQDPEIMAIVQDIMMSPDNFGKHVGNPRVTKVLERIYTLTNGESALKQDVYTPEAEQVVSAPPDASEERTPDGKKKKVRVPIRGL